VVYRWKFSLLQTRNAASPFSTRRSHGQYCPLFCDSHQFATEELGITKSGVCAHAAQRWHGMDRVP
jgi:hypothetical protein